jgi:hypothetical protein
MGERASQEKEQDGRTYFDVAQSRNKAQNAG